MAKKKVMEFEDEIVETEATEKKEKKKSIKKEVSAAPVEEEVVKEETPKEIIPFDDVDKEAIVNILRPIIKGINSDELYASICEALLQTKVLKTYATLSEDKKTLTILQ